MQKLEILTDAARFDVACTSSGVERKGDGKHMGNCAKAGICHSFSSDGRCISLLKILMTNECIFDCKYCLNRKSNDVPRATFTPEEICTLTMEFYRRNYIEGLFLSSGIVQDPTFTMELLYRTIWLLRNHYHFNGYVHVKAIPGADPELVQRMIDEGHVVGNHSWKHPNYSGLSVEEAEQDLMKLHDYVKENFNYTMRYFRFPAGNFSERALAEVQQLGYKSLFWSFAYKDWLTDDQPDEAESLQKIVDSACPGMVYLLHAVSKTNANVLADVIDGVAVKGFTWGDPSKI